MRVPQVNERVKEAPAHALRAMFAGIGQLLSVSDKIRGKSASAPAGAETPETVAPETVAPETVVAETATPETVAPETVAAKTVAPETEPAAAGAALPLPNYDELTIASLRARLRNLSADQLGELIEYEKAHAARADVISMFERRIAKLAEG
jgi:hypothetical protein